MESEVLKIRKELEKTVPKNDVKRALELLRSLESIPMTLDVLQKTHIGMAVNKIRKTVDSQEIGSLSKSMVKKWKKLLSSSSTSSSAASATASYNNNNNNNNSSISNNNNNGNSNNNLSASNPTNATNQTNINASHNYGQQSDSNTHSPVSQQPLTPPVSSSSSSASTPATSATTINSSASNSIKGKPVEKRQFAPSQTEVPPTTSEVRLKCRQLLAEALKKPLPKELQTSDSFLEEEILAGRIEECIFQEFKITDMKYKNRIRGRVSNLGDVKNPYLRLNVLLGVITPDRIAKMSAEEMASDELKKQREQYTKEAINDHQMSLTTGTKTSEIKCPACKKYNVTYNQVQTRSADEPMTTFCFCNECGRRWKFC